MSPPDIPQVLVYRIDAGGRITYVNTQWSEFARDNQGEAVMPSNILGTRLIDSVTDMAVRELYLRMIKRARSGKPVSFHYRCDAPSKRRLFVMHIRLLAGGEVEFASVLKHEEARPRVALLEPGGARAASLLRVCSWCQKVATPDGQWRPVEEAVETMQLLHDKLLPGITHGICEPCKAGMMENIEAG